MKKLEVKKLVINHIKQKNKNNEINSFLKDK